MHKPNPDSGSGQVRVLPTSSAIYDTARSTFRDFYGHNATIGAKELLDEDGQHIPWFTYPAINYLKQLDFTDASVFEYGAGSSTQFWARRSKCVYSVENDANWFDHLHSNLPSNCNLALATSANYSKRCEHAAPHDVIVVDGRWRFDCAQEALKNVAPDGMLILDNSERYPEITRLFRAANYIQVDMIGYGPFNWYTWATSLFFSRLYSRRPASECQPSYTAGNVDSYERSPEKFAPFNRPGSY